MFRPLMCLIKRSGKKKIHRENKISNPKLKASRNFWVSNLAKSNFYVLASVLASFLGAETRGEGGDEGGRGFPANMVLQIEKGPLEENKKKIIQNCLIQKLINLVIDVR